MNLLFCNFIENTPETMITLQIDIFHGRCRSEIKSRIWQAKIAFQKMRSTICNKVLSIEVRMRIIQCYIAPILTYTNK
uniref:Uncharacterized protein n=1 Tax=Arion vulgaris TaxID=1028688 RepID=A0A0B7AJT6_9EUPU